MCGPHAARCTVHRTPKKNKTKHSTGYIFAMISHKLSLLSKVRRFPITLYLDSGYLRTATIDEDSMEKDGLQAESKGSEDEDTNSSTFTESDDATHPSGTSVGMR